MCFLSLVETRMETVPLACWLFLRNAPHLVRGFFNRIGFVDGFKHQRRFRRWGSSRWLREGVDEESSQCHERNADRMNWMMEVYVCRQRGSAFVDLVSK